MSRLIDMDSIIEKYGDWYIEEEGPDEYYIGYIGSLKTLLRNEPTIDAEPVRHGRWIDSLCSECVCYVYEGDMRYYCPQCGAKMDGEMEGEG